MKTKRNKTEQSTTQVRGFLALVTVFLVIVGQTILYTTPVNPDIVIPVSIWICVVGVILFLLVNFLRPPQFLLKMVDRLPSTGVLPWIICALALSILATFTMALFEKAGRRNYLPVTSLWLASAICYIAAFMKSDFFKADWRDWLKTHRTELILVGIATLLGLAVRFYKLGAIPRVILSDEGWIGLVAQSTGSGPMANPFALWDNFGAFYLQLINYCFTIFGTSTFTLRLLPAIGGVLSIPAVYLFTRQLAGKRIALIAAVLLAFSHTSIHYSRTVAVAYIQGTWLVPLLLYFLLSGLEKRASWRTALAGIIMAIHFSVYLTAQIEVGLVLAFVLIAFIFLRSWIKPAFRQVLVFWGGFLIVFIPEAYFILHHTNDFFARLNTDGTFQSGWLNAAMKLTGHSAVQILGERVIHAFLSLIYFPSIDFYGSPTPMLTLIAASLFMVGLGIALWKWRSPGYLLLNGYFWGFTLAVGIFAIPPSADTYRMLIALPAAIILAAVGLDQILEIIGWGWKNSRLKYGVVTGMVLLSLAITNLWTYYGDFAAHCLYGGDTQARFSSYLGAYAGTVKAEDTIYLLSNDTYRYGTHGSVDFLSQSRVITNVPDPVDTLTASSGEVIIASPDRIEELKTWAHANPGGTLKYTYDCTKLIMVTYSFP